VTPRLPVASGRQTVKALQRLGFEEVSQRGSHIKVRDEKGKTAISRFTTSSHAERSVLSSDRPTSAWKTSAQPLTDLFTGHWEPLKQRPFTRDLSDAVDAFNPWREFRPLVTGP
jgi:predicted RNA binding protein YcfA (HicA-like mRNA interferase family)